MNRRRIWLLIALLCAALAAVSALIVFKHYEYSVSEEYYNSLRLGTGGV